MLISKLEQKYKIAANKNYKNLDNFFALYLKNLEKAIEENPNSYAYSKDKAKEVADRMKKAVHEKGIGGVNIDSPAFKKTAKELGIKSTYKDIEKYLMG